MILIFSISVINSDENSDYTSPEGVEGEYDEYNQITLKEQSLVMDFDDSVILSKPESYFFTNKSYLNASERVSVLVSTFLTVTSSQ